MAKDYYQILGINKSASPSDIKSAYKKLAKKYHPDLNKSANAETKFKEINEAYEILSDDNKKYKYDHYNITDDQMSGGGEHDFNDFFKTEDFNVEDIFSMFHGGGNETRGYKRQKQNNHETHEIYISFMQSIKGCSYPLEYTIQASCKTCKGTKAFEGKSEYISKCSKCNGHGYEVIQARSVFGIVNTKTNCNKCFGKGTSISKACKACVGKGYSNRKKQVNIKITAGINDKEMLSFKDSESYIDKTIILKINIKPSSIFKRVKNDIYTKAIIHPILSILGGEISIPTLTGIKKINIAPGTGLGELIKVKGEGIKINLFSQGNLYVKIYFDKIKLTKEDEKKLRSINFTESTETIKFLKEAQKEINEHSKS